MHGVGNGSERLVISTWGNDFSLFAASSPKIASLTRQVVTRADALHSDCRKDVVLATEYGYDPERPTLVAPGNGGVDGGAFYEGPADATLKARLTIGPGSKVVINPRGLKPYVRNVEFLQAIPKILEKAPDTTFLFASMEGKALVEGWVRATRHRRAGASLAIRLARGDGGPFPPLRCGGLALRSRRDAEHAP